MSNPLLWTRELHEVEVRTLPYADESHVEMYDNCTTWMYVAFYPFTKIPGMKSFQHPFPRFLSRAASSRNDWF